jgi:D-xylose transport system substrate-binding protein
LTLRATCSSLSQNYLNPRDTNSVTGRRADSGQRSETIRRTNLSALVQALHADGPLSRSELVERTGLTRSGIRRLVGELVTAGLVVEERGESLGTRGRPSPLVRLDPGSAVVLALEIAVDSLAMAVVGLGGHVFELVRVDLSRGHLTADDLVTDLAALADGAAPLWRRDALVGIGVAVVGVVRRDDGFVSIAPNLGWHDVPLGQALTAALVAPAPVVVANEADLGALAEHRRGAAEGADDVIFLSGEVGVGGGLIVGGQPLTGVAGFGGEVGHLPVNPLAGVTCRCGSVGCWETEVGEEALLMRAGRPAGGGSAAVDAILGDAGAGDATALAALDEIGTWLGIGLAGLVNTLNPARVVLGGRFARLHPFVAPTMEAVLDRRALAAPRALVEVVPARLGVDAPLLGAAELAFEPILSDPASWFHRPGAVGERRRARRSPPQPTAEPAGALVHRTKGGMANMSRFSRIHRGSRHATGEETRMYGRRTAALIMGAAAILAACGSSGGGGSAATTAAAAGGATTAAGGGATTVAGGAATTAAAGGGGGCTVGVSWNNYQEERWAKWDEPAIKDAVAAGGGTYISNDAKSSAETQATNVENLISQGANVLIILAQDGTAIKPSVASAVSQGVPVIGYDRLIEDPGALYITFDNVEVGRLEATPVFAAVPKGNYIIIKGNKADANADFLRSGYDDIIKAAVDSGDIKIVGETYTDNWDPSKAQTETEQFLTANNNDVQAVLSENDGMAGGVVAALTAQGLAGKVPVSGQDGDQAALNRVALGTQTVDVWKDSRELGKAAGEAAIQLCKDKDIKNVTGVADFASPGGNTLTSILLKPIPITKDNLNVVLDAGWIDKATLCKDVPAGSVAACG